MLDILFGISSAAAEAVEGAGTAGTENGAGAASIGAMIVSLLPMVLIFVVFYFFLIRPQRKKDKQVKEMLNALKPGDRICTIGGIYGTIKSLKDDTVSLVVGKDDTSMVVARWAIRSVEDIKIENDSEALN